MKHWTTKLEALSACEEAVAWCRDKPDLATAWADCERGDWMLWLLGRTCGPVGSESRRTLVGAAAECARLALPLYENRHPGNEHVRECLDLCDRYAAGDESVSLAMLRSASDAAFAAYATATTADAYAAAYAAVYVANVATATAAATAVAAVAVRRRVLSQCADIVRRRYPQAPALENA